MVHRQHLAPQGHGGYSCGFSKLCSSLSSLMGAPLDSSSLLRGAGSVLVCLAPRLLTCRGQPFGHLASDRAIENEQAVSY